MAGIADALMQELEHEGATTRRVLERVPDGKLDWQPHTKSMTLGRLAHHISTVPGDVATIASVDEFDFANFPRAEQPTTAAGMLESHDQSVAKAKAYLAGLDDASAMSMWKGTMGGNPMMTMPRVAVIRNIMLNHWIHHRGQLSVYLRLLDVPVPSIYGPSADEDPVR
jgi:uncharacterized damage-inducible protein DinB